MTSLWNKPAGKAVAWALAALALLGGGGPLLAADAPPAPAAASGGQKVFRYAFPVAETGFDPAQLSDLYSRIITANIFDALYGYEYLARPARIKPVLAQGMPEVSADFRTWTVRLKPGVFFADDAAFGGRKREVTAQDVVYTYKRIYDPKNKSPSVAGLEEEKLLGMNELRQRALKEGKFDYDNEVEGLRALDRYTVQFKLAEPRPRFLNGLADPGILGIMAREVVEKYGDRIMEHPVGTGPFMLSEWKRSSRITLVRNPNFREEIFDEEAPGGDEQAKAIAARLKGKRLPMVDKVVVSIVEEPQPRWLAFLNNEHDLMERVPQNFANQATPNNKLAPNLARRGIQMERGPLSDITMFYFRMDHPVVGGYTPEKVALRRAISLAYNTAEEVRLARRGQAIIAQGPVMPNTRSYDPALRTDMGRFDRAAAIALLDMYGYTDKNGDGWRDMPDGSPLVLEYDTLGTSDYRELDEIFKRSLDAIGIRIKFRIGKWPEQLKASRAGKLMMWGYGLSASSPDSGGSLAMGYTKSLGQQNHSRFSLPAFDALYQKQSAMPDGPERDAVIREAVRLLVAYAPVKIRTHRIGTDLMQPWVIGYKRHPNAREFWRYVDIDTALVPR